MASLGRSCTKVHVFSDISKVFHQNMWKTMHVSQPFTKFYPTTSRFYVVQSPLSPSWIPNHSLTVVCRVFFLRRKKGLAVTPWHPWDSWQFDDLSCPALLENLYESITWSISSHQSGKPNLISMSRTQLVHEWWIVGFAIQSRNINVYEWWIFQFQPWLPEHKEVVYCWLR